MTLKWTMLQTFISSHLLIGVTIYLGMMTQYFFVVYAFLLCAAYDLYLMFRREWKNAAAFSLSASAGKPLKAYEIIV